MNLYHFMNSRRVALPSHIKVSSLRSATAQSHRILPQLFFSRFNLFFLAIYKGMLFLYLNLVLVLASLVRNIDKYDLFFKTVVLDAV